MYIEILYTLKRRNWV